MLRQGLVGRAVLTPVGTVMTCLAVDDIPNYVDLNAVQTRMRALYRQVATTRLQDDERAGDRP